MTTEKQMNNVVEAEKAVKAIREMISKATDLKLVENESKTGFSYFAGKKRLCKLLKSKRGVTLEINVPLSKKFSEQPEFTNISKDLAHRKHLGTMKHLYRSADCKQIRVIMAEALKVFALEVAEAEVAEQPVKEA